MMKEKMKKNERCDSDSKLFERTLAVLGLKFIEDSNSLADARSGAPADAFLGDSIEDCKRSGFEPGNRFSLIFDKHQFLRDELPHVDFFGVYHLNECYEWRCDVKLKNAFRGCKNLDEIAVRCDLLEA